MTKFALFLSLLITGSSTIYAQTLIKGKAVDNKGGIGFISVNLLSAKDSGFIKGQVADSAGTFELPGIRAGKYLLLLSAFGYNKLYMEVNAAGSVVNLGEILLSLNPQLLNEVTITGEKPPFQRQADKLVVNISGNKLFASAANAFDIIKKIPGLEVNGDGTIQMSGRVTPGVFIDGKAVPMSPEELQNYLNSLTPEQIASIEVINNPSSRYDGEHKGIIDIKLKRDMTLGWKGMANVNFQQNAYAYADNNLLLTYKTKKLTYTARLGYATGNKPYRYHALQHLANTNIMSTNTNVRTGHNNYSYQLGADYNFRKGQQVEIILRASQLNRDIHSFNTLHTTDASAKNLVFATNTTIASAPKQSNYGANLSYTGRFGNKQLEILGTILRISNQQNEDIQTKNTSTAHLLDYWKTNLENNILIRSAQADLSGTAGKGKWSTGARFAFTTTKNHLRYDTLNTEEVFIPDHSRSNSFQYDEYITAGYAAYERTGKKLSYALSLRAEYTHSVALSSTVTTRDYVTWLPAFSVTWPLSASQQLNLSYSRRITRPSFFQINPFRFYLSPLNYVVGNPYLQPSTTQMARIVYSQKAFSLSLQFGRESDPMTRYPEYDSATNILEYLGGNLPHNDFAALELSFPFVVNKWWRMNNTIRGGYNKEQRPYHNVTYVIPIFDYTVSGSQVFTLPKAVTFDISYYYRSLSGNGLYISKPMASVDLSLQKRWLKGKLNTKFSYYDIFDNYKVRFIFREKNIINNALNHWFGNRRAALTLGYSFGTSTHKGKQRSSNDEEGRAGM